MYSEFIDDAMLQMYIYDTMHILEKIEQVMMQSEQVEVLSKAVIDQVFRDLHTIKVSSATMVYKNISEMAHVLEDLLFMIRNDLTLKYDLSLLIDLIFEGIDFCRIMLLKVSNNQLVYVDVSQLKYKVKLYIDDLKANNKIDLIKNTIDTSCQYLINIKTSNI